MSKTQEHPGGAARGDLIDRLVADLKPVEAIKTARLYAICFGIQALVAVIAFWSFGLGVESLARLGDPVYLLLIGVLASSAAACTLVALRSAIPGRGVARPISVVLLLVPVLLAAGVSATSPWGGAWPGMLPLLASGKMCMAKISGIAVFPWLAMLFVLRWLAPLRELATGMFIGLAAFLLGAFAVQFTCNVNDHYHLAFAHYAPVILGTIAAGAISAAVLRRGRSN